MNIDIHSTLPVTETAVLSSKEKKRLYDRGRYLQKRNDPAFRRSRALKQKLYQSQLTTQQKKQIAARRRTYEAAHPEWSSHRKVYHKKYYQINKSYIAKKSRHYSLHYFYKLTEPEYIHMLWQQNNQCAVCHQSSASKKLSIDHDHKCCSGKRTCGKCIRGLLCSRCNAILGQVNDSVSILESMIQYLKQRERLY